MVFLFLFFFFYKSIYLFLFGCVGSSLLHAGFLWLHRAGATLLLRCAVFSLLWLLLLQSTGSRHAGFSSCGSWALEHRLNRCGARAYLLSIMWDLPGPGLEPVSPALAGGFLTTVPTGKSDHMVFLLQFVNMVYHNDWFAYIEESLHPWGKSHLIMVYDPFNVLLDSVC